MLSQASSVSIISTTGALATTSASAAARTARSPSLTDAFCRTAKTRHPRGYMEGRYLERQHDVEEADKPFEFFMNRFRLLEAAPRAEFSRYTGLEWKRRSARSWTRR